MLGALATLPPQLRMRVEGEFGLDEVVWCGNRSCVMESEKKFVLRKVVLLRVLVFAFCVPVFFVFGSDSVDLDNYSEAYEKGWYQFGPAFNLLMLLFKAADLPFVSLWFFLGFLISVLFSVIYSRYELILFAAPNIFFLLSGSYSTQLRFSLGSLFFVYLYGQKSRVLIFFSSMIHLSMLIPLVLRFSLDRYFRCCSSILCLRNLSFLLALAGFVLLSYYFSTILMGMLGYSHYIDSKHLAPKSISSVLYIVISLALVSYILIYVGDQTSYRRYVCFALGILLCCICYSGYAMVSGRLLMLYFLFEPFVMSHMFRSVRKNGLGWLFIVVVVAFQLSKFGAMV